MLFCPPYSSTLFSPLMLVASASDFICITGVIIDLYKVGKRVSIPFFLLFFPPKITTPGL